MVKNSALPGLLWEDDGQVVQCQVGILVNRDSNENAAALHVLTVSTQSAITCESPNPLGTCQILNVESHRRQRCKYRTERDNLESIVGCTCALASNLCRAKLNNQVR